MRRHADQHHGRQGHEEKGHAAALYKARFNEVPEIIVGGVAALQEAGDGEYHETECHQLA